jgi:tetratricopeptide (TPR) repeat protein
VAVAIRRFGAQRNRHEYLSTPDDRGTGDIAKVGFRFSSHRAAGYSQPSMRTCLLLLCCVLIHVSRAGARDGADAWSEVRSANFTVLTDTSAKEGQRIAEQFERMRAVFAMLMPAANEGSGSPIVVLALKDGRAMADLEPESYLAKGQMNLAGLFMRAPDKNYILMRLDAEGPHPFTTVYHEYTHYMLRNASEWLPLWLNEGLAEFYQNSVIAPNEVLLGQASDEDVRYLREKQLLPLSTLFTVDSASPYYHEEQKASVFYAESWALTHMIALTDAERGTNRLQQYANLLAHKQDPLGAAQEAFGDLNRLQMELARYIAKGRFMMFKMDKAIRFQQAAFQVRSVPLTDVNAIRAEIMICNQRNGDAERLLQSVLQIDPKNALAHESMGFLKLREGDQAGARQWYSEAAQENPLSYLAHYYYATTSMSVEGEGADPAIEASLAKAVQLNADFAPAYDALARYYMRVPGHSAEAQRMNAAAMRLEPDNLNYRLNAAAVLLSDHQFGDAVSVLKSASLVARTPEEVATVSSRIDLIEQYEQAAIMAQEDLAQAQSAPPVVVVSDTRATTLTGGNGRTIVLRPDGPDDHPRYPTEDPTGTRHTARGLVRDVRCSYPMILTFTVDEGSRSHRLLVYRNDFRQIDFSAVNFDPKGDLNPCTDLEGLKAKVQYAEVSDKSVAGQILSVQLTK